MRDESPTGEVSGEPFATSGMRRRRHLLLYLPTLLLVLLSGLGEMVRVGSLMSVAEERGKYDTARTAARAFLDSAARGQVPYDAARSAVLTRALMSPIAAESTLTESLADLVSFLTRLTAVMAVCQLALAGWYWRRRAREDSPDRVDPSLGTEGGAA